jgi:hypothetical protein
MNKRQRLANLRNEIFNLAVQLFTSDNITFEEAKRRAAQEVAAKARLKPKQMSQIATHPIPTQSGDAHNTRETLFSKLVAIRQRMFPDASPEDDMTAALAERSGSNGSKPNDGMLRQVLKRIKLAEDDPPIAPTEQPVPAEYSMPASSQVFCGRPTREVIDERREFPVGLSDIATRNYQEQQRTANYKAQTPQNEIDPNDSAAVEAALQRQQANIIAFPRVSK